MKIFRQPKLRVGRRHVHYFQTKTGYIAYVFWKEEEEHYCLRYRWDGEAYIVRGRVQGRTLGQVFGKFRYRVSSHFDKKIIEVRERVGRRTYEDGDYETRESIPLAERR